MYAVGRFISRGVYTVSSPFHPFGGAVDIIVVEQQDGSFKSSPWYVQFGKFQGVLKTKEKVVNLCVNGEDADFHMYLDHKGEAYFLKEVEVEDDDSSGDEKDGIFRDNQRSLESKSCNFGDGTLSIVDQRVLSNEKMMTRSTSRQLRLFGLVFGRKSMKESQHDREDDSMARRIDSLERAEYAAELLEVKWSTNLASNKSRKDNVPASCGLNMLNSEAHSVTQIDAERSQQSAPVYDGIKYSMDQDNCSGNVHEGNQGFENYFEKSTLEVSCSSTPDNHVETSTVGEGVSESKHKVVSEVCELVDESMSLVAEDKKNPERVLSGISGLGCHVLHPIELEECTDKHFDEEYSSHNKNAVLPSCSICPEEDGTDKVGSFICSESSETPMVRKEDASKQQTYVPSIDGECGKFHFLTEILQPRPELPSKDDAKEIFEEVVGFTGLEELNERYMHLTNPSLSRSYNDNMLQPLTSLSRNPMLGLVEVIDSESICTISNVSDSGCLVQDDKIMKDGSSTTNSQLSSKYISEHVATENPTLHGPHCLEEEQFLFSDIDDSKIHEIQKSELNFPLNMDGENCCSHSQEGIVVLNGPVNKRNKVHASPVMSADEDPLIDLKNSIVNLRESSKPMDIPRNYSVTGNEVERLAESMPNVRPCAESFGVCDLNLSQSLDSNSRKLDADKVRQLSSEVPGIKNAQVPAELESVPADGALGISSQPSLSPSGRWRLWPFRFRRSTSSVVAMPLASGNSNTDNAIENKTGQNQVNTSNSTADDASENIISKNGNNIGDYIADSASERKIGMSGNSGELKPRVVKKMVRITSPTSEQLASLNLKEGRNTVTFTFSTAMLGNQQVEARIYLWKWNTRIVISDVDGTITRSDVLGQFMPLVGVDWSQTGVTHLFSAIKENGYQILFLSARAISQAYHTRQFLFNLKQDGKTLPDGPMFISPDGLLPSLYREVIRRTPHEFKIACLEEIRSLFPSDCNPFYAGFGNRDTDEFSYLKVGIPKGKIFTINSKGEVAVDHRHDTRSYTSLHGLVNGMFPSTSVSEKEDFNSWNFWKIPPPAINV